MRTCGTEGEIIGMAASLCRKHDTTPRDIYDRHLPELQDLMRRGAGKLQGSQIDYVNQGSRRTRGSTVLPQSVNLPAPAWLKTAGPNLARTARVTIPGAPTGGVRTELLLTDGNGLVEDNAARWVNPAPLPHLVDFNWDSPVRIGAARIVSGYHRNGTVEAPIRDFSLQWHDGITWKDVPGATIRGNTLAAWSRTFDAVDTSHLRLRITATPGDISRIWEVEFYAPPSGNIP
jgi:hypothetical protein